jgi:GTPase SAR1 family protein
MFAQIVMGPAGSGKSTYCAAMQTHAQMMNRTIHIMNADPAAEGLKYEPSLDIRNLISIDDVKEELGPNGGLVYCIEHLTNNLDWLTEQLGEEYTEDYLLIDMPGQVELYTHYKHINLLAQCLQGQKKKKKKEKEKRIHAFSRSRLHCVQCLLD